MDATRADPEFLAEVVRAALSAGATTINIPDTVGFFCRIESRPVFARCRRDVPELDEPSSRFTARTISDWPRPTRWPRCAPERGKWSWPSTGSASERGIRRSKKWSWRCACTALARRPHARGHDRHLRAVQARRRAERSRRGREQGHRRQERVSSRFGHSSGRRAEEARNVRGHRSRVGRAPDRDRDCARQAVGASGVRGARQSPRLRAHGRRTRPKRSRAFKRWRTRSAKSGTSRFLPFAETCSRRGEYRPRLRARAGPVPGCAVRAAVCDRPCIGKRSVSTETSLVLLEVFRKTWPWRAPCCHLVS